MAKFCRFCGKPVKENAKFCENCGKSLAKASAAPVPPVCPRCGEPLAPDVVFCGNCGQNLQQGTGYAPAATEPAVPENRQQDWNPAQNQQQGWTPQQQQGREYHQQQRWAQPQPQPGPNVRESVQAKPQGRSVSSLLQGSGSRKMLLAAAAAVILLVVGITGFWKPGFLRSSSSKLENGMLALNDIALDFKQTNLKNGAATLATVKDKKEEVQNGLIGDLYVMKFDKSCKGKVTVSVPAPKDFKPTTGTGLYIKLGVGREYGLANGKTTRLYSYFNTNVKDGKVVATFDPAILGKGLRKCKASAKPEEKNPDMGEFTVYVGAFYKQNGKYPEVLFGKGFKNSKGHFRLWYNDPQRTDLVDKLAAKFNPEDFKPFHITDDDAKKLLNDLEEAYNYYKTHGYKDRVDTYTPIDVYITCTENEGGWDPLTGNMELRQDRIFGPENKDRYEGDWRKKTRTTIYHEFFHAVQQTYIGTYAFLNDTKKSNWFDEATGTHFEKLVTKEVSENGMENFWSLWQGLIPEGSSKEEGYARGLLIDFMSSRLGGDAWIKDCYEHWSEDYSKFKEYMKKTVSTEADFSAKFYLEVIKGLGHLPPIKYYNQAQKASADMKEDVYLSTIRMELDKQAKEIIDKNEKNSRPISIAFTSQPFELEGYGGHVVSLVTKVYQSSENLAKELPNKCQLKLVASGGCRLQILKIKGKNTEIINGNVIENFKEQSLNGNLYIVLVTSTKPIKQNVIVRATLSKEGKKGGNFSIKDAMSKFMQEETERQEQRIKKEGTWLKLK